MVVILFKVYLHSGALVIKSDVLLNAVSVLVTPLRTQDRGAKMVEVTGIGLNKGASR